MLFSDRWKSLVPTELRALLALGGLAGLVLLLVKIIEDVVEKESGKFDQAILLALRVPGDLSKPIGPEGLKPFFLDITALGSPTTVTLVTIVAVAYRCRTTTPRKAGWRRDRHRRGS